MKSEAAHVIIIIITQNVDEFTVSNASFCSSDIFINVSGMIFFLLFASRLLQDKADRYLVKNP